MHPFEIPTFTLLSSKIAFLVHPNFLRSLPYKRKTHHFNVLPFLLITHPFPTTLSSGSQAIKLFLSLTSMVVPTWVHLSFQTFSPSINIYLSFTFSPFLFSYSNNKANQYISSSLSLTFTLPNLTTSLFFFLSPLTSRNHLLSLLSLLSSLHDGRHLRKKTIRAMRAPRSFL